MREDFAPDDAVLVVQQVALTCALDQANAGRVPQEQVRDPRRLARVLCAWCGRLLRYAVWQQPDGLQENTSHGVCDVCLAKHFPREVNTA